MSGTTERETEILAKIAVKNIGDPKNLFKMPEGETRCYLGRLAGVATGKKDKPGPNGDIFVAILGDFMGIPADDRKPILRSGVLYLPGGIHEMVLEQLSGEGSRVEFAFDIYSETASNAIGYSYAVNPVFQPSATDPVAILLAKSAEMRPMPRRAIAAPVVETGVNEPADEKKGKK